MRNFLRTYSTDKGSCLNEYMICVCMLLMIMSVSVKYLGPKVDKMLIAGGGTASTQDGNGDGNGCGSLGIDTPTGVDCQVD